MADHDEDINEDYDDYEALEEEPQSDTATATETKPEEKKKPTPPKVGELPPYKVLLHNDDVNDVLHVISSIVMLTPIKFQEAIEKTYEAHHKGLSLLLITHKERAELYVEQFKSKRLKVTIEPVITG